MHNRPYYETALNYGVRFQDVWRKALREEPPNPEGAIGDLARLLEDVFDVEQIQHAAVGPATSFLFDLTPLGFSGMGWNIVVVSPPPQNDEEAAWQARFLAEQKHATDSTGFCFHIYLSDDPQPRNPHVGMSQEAVFLSRLDLDQIVSAQVPKMAFAAVVRKQTPVSRLCPFNTNQEASGAMFFGRRNELSMVVEDLSRSVAIQGARRIGKTSLLKNGYRILRNRLGVEGRSRVFYFNCLTWSNYAHACHALAHKIDPKRELRLGRAERNVEYMLERCSRGGSRPMYLFFDETDRLIDLDAAGNWKFFNLLAWAKDAGLIRFVLAGYRSVSRLVLGQEGGSDSADRVQGSSLHATETPLLLALEPLTLSPLTRKDSDALLTEPLQSTDIKFESQSQILDRVWAATAGYPFLVQFFGQHLYNRCVERKSQTVTMQDVMSVERSADLCEFLETHFIENTLHNGVAAPLERICAFLIAHSDDSRWTEQDFWEAYRDHQLSIEGDEMAAVHRAVKNLCDAQVLTNSQGRYSFAFPVMKSVLTNSYPDVFKAVKALAGT